MGLCFQNLPSTVTPFIIPCRISNTNVVFTTSQRIHLHTPTSILSSVQFGGQFVFSPHSQAPVTSFFFYSVSLHLCEQKGRQTAHCWEGAVVEPVTSNSFGGSKARLDVTPSSFRHNTESRGVGFMTVNVRTELFMTVYDSI